jgi:glycosyltransferase involved in cell wall biosynthesis
MSETGNAYEMILVDDGSSDRSWPLVQMLAHDDPCVFGYRLRRNFGKAAALALGAEVASGSIIITLDADLQDDPAEIPKLVGHTDDEMFGLHRRELFDCQFRID